MQRRGRTPGLAATRSGAPCADRKRATLLWRFRLLPVLAEILDERHLIAPGIVRELVDHPAGDEDAEAALPQAQLVAKCQMRRRVGAAGGVREVGRVEARALVGDHEF